MKLLPHGLMIMPKNEKMKDKKLYTVPHQGSLHVYNTTVSTW